MNVVAWIVGLVLTAGFMMSGAMKLMGQPMAMEMAEKLGFTKLRQAIGGAEVAGAVGVFIGLLSDGGTEWLGFLAAIGLIATMVGAIVYHARAGDKPKEMMPAAVMGALAVLYIVAIGAR